MPDTLLSLTTASDSTLAPAAIAVGIAAIVLWRNYRSIPKNKPHRFRDLLRYHEPYEAVTSRHRGTASERWIVSKLVRYGLKPTAIYHDLLVAKARGKHSQIDIVVATDVGLIVMEVKDYSGWIFGKGNQEYWTKITRYGKRRYRFYNPFKQNAGHINALRRLSPQMQQLPMYSMVVFCGDCELKDVNFIPPGCYLATGGSVVAAVDHIINAKPRASYSDKWEVARLLQKAVADGGDQHLQVQHVANIHGMLGTDRRFG